jgi:phenylacetate-CoA ligase
VTGTHSLDLEAIYQRLPITLQHAGCSLVGWRTERTRYDDTFARIFEEALARSRWSVEDVATFRDRRLVAHLERAVQTSSFYRRRFQDAGLAPSDVRSMADLASLPILAKDEVQDHIEDIVSTGMSGTRTRLVHTSGTTGGALRFPVTARAVQEQWATWWRYRSWHGIRRGTWCALFAGRSVVPSSQKEPPFWRVNYPGRQLLFSGYHLSPTNLPAYVGELQRRRPPWLHGYPSLLALIAAHLIEADADLGYQVRWVTTGAENLLPHQADLLERAFAVRPIQHYGLAEGVANLSQCELNSLHVDEDFAAVEFVPTGRGNAYRIVGTNFMNPATPLLRYDTQDVAALRDDGSCACGRPGRVVERVDGRLEDYVVLGNGARIGRMDHIFKDMVNIREAQIHQDRPGEITILVVRGRAFDRGDEQVLLRETKKRVGDGARVGIAYVDSLPRSPTGKLRFVVSELTEASIAASSARS